MNAYELKQAARKERQADRALRLSQEATATYNRARSMAEAIPFGQPILVGHYSEKRDRNYRARINSTFGKAFALSNAAAEAEASANSTSNAISSDDPDAPDKLSERIAALEAKQARMVAVNAASKSFKVSPDSPASRAKMAALSEAEQNLVRTYVPAYSWEPHPFAPYQMTNNGANIRRLKLRLAEVKKKAEATAEPDVTGDGYVIREDIEDNRLLIIFDAIPDAARRTKLKSCGFRWSPTRKAWVRQLNNRARWCAKQALS